MLGFRCVVVVMMVPTTGLSFDLAEAIIARHNVQPSRGVAHGSNGAKTSGKKGSDVSHERIATE